MLALTVFGIGVGFVSIGVAVHGSLSTMLIAAGGAVCFASIVLYLLRPASEVPADSSIDTGDGAFRGNVITDSTVNVHSPPTHHQQRGNPLNRALGNAETELDSIRDSLRDAQQAGWYPLGFYLPALHFQALSDALADRDMSSSRRIVSAAYNACDKLNKLVDAREWDGAPIPHREAAKVESADGLENVLGQVDAALAELRGV
jgi:hypothetical protein